MQRTPKWAPNRSSGAKILVILSVGMPIYRLFCVPETTLRPRRPSVPLLDDFVCLLYLPCLMFKHVGNKPAENLHNNSPKTCNKKLINFTKRRKRNTPQASIICQEPPRNAKDHRGPRRTAQNQHRTMHTNGSLNT